MEKYKYHDNKEKKSKNIHQQKHLPHDLIIQQILPCLPIKNLIQSKLVCKDWYSSISCSKFILKHYHKSVFSHPFTPLKCLIIQSSYKTYYLYHCDHDYNNNDNPIYPSEVESSNLVKLTVNFDVDVNDKVNLVGSSNGLVCLAETYGIYFILWNPFTNEYQKYYPQDFQLLISSRYRQFVNWGFGFVSSPNDHKVIRIMRCWNGEFITVHVFSLRLNAWKKIEFGYVDCFLQHGRAKLVNETLYWTLCNFDGSKKIVGFDLVNERFNLFFDLMISDSNERLCVMGGCLGKYGSKTRMDMVMDIVKFGGRVVSVGFECDLMNVLDCDELIGFTKSGKILVMYNNLKKLYLVDTNSKQFLVTFKDGDGMTRIDSYVPSQISPFASVEGGNATGQVGWNPF